MFESVLTVFIAVADATSFNHASEEWALDHAALGLLHTASETTSSSTRSFMRQRRVKSQHQKSDIARQVLTGKKTVQSSPIQELDIGPRTLRHPNRAACKVDPATDRCILGRHAGASCEFLERVKDDLAMEWDRPPQSGSKIPMQLVATGQTENFEDLDPKVRQHFENILLENPNMKIRWLGNKACSKYVQSSVAALAEHYDDEPSASNRADICKAVVLLREGGFSLDWNFVPKNFSVRTLVDKETHFMSAFSKSNGEAREHVYGGSLLNSVVAVEPRSAILAATVFEISKWYRGDRSVPWGFLGPIQLGSLSLWRGVDQVMKCRCPDMQSLDGQWLAAMDSDPSDLQWSCGGRAIRLYAEKQLECKSASEAGSLVTTGSASNVECPSERARSTFDGVRYGIFAPGDKRQLIGWPLPTWCQKLGCGIAESNAGHSDAGSNGSDLVHSKSVGAASALDERARAGNRGNDQGGKLSLAQAASDSPQLTLFKPLLERHRLDGL